MALRNATPVTFHPAGVSDTLDGSTVMRGAMALLQNLIPDPSTKHLWQCRPAVTLLSLFTPTFNTPTYVSVMACIGDYLYGMLATRRNPGFDEPFAFNLLTNQFTPISGVTPSNVPTSPPSSGAWKPPQMALIGTKLMVAHPGFSGLAGAYVGQIDITNPALPVWSANQLSGLIQFTSAPTAVAQFNQRAWYAINPPTGQPSVIFSDPLNPLHTTDANQALTFGDSQKLTALASLPLSNQVTGGVVQSLIVFKGVAALYQVTGDATTQNLSINALPTPTGTQAPDSIASTPYGLAFIAIDGLRLINFNAQVVDPVGAYGDGKTLPFMYSVVPSRMNAAANNAVYRVSTQDGSVPGAPVVEYWYHFVTKGWSGPHTFPTSQIQPYNNTFILTPYSGTPAIYRSDFFQSAVSSFAENGQPLSCIWRTAMLPDTDEMRQNAMVESTIYMALPPGLPPFVVKALDQEGRTIQQVTLDYNSPLTLWGQFTWGSAPWFGVPSALNPRPLPWPAPVEFRRLQLDVTLPGSANLKIGTLHLRYQKLGYLQEGFAA